ncbi:MAG: hypothetical protein HY318_01525 [Armatimonadetes bacterium]|nr:hypothetical protein [Armatimonadota bacterium]
MPIIETTKEMMTPRKIPEYYWDASDWVGQHSIDLQREFPDHWIAVFDGQVVAAGKDLGEVRDEAEQETGVEDFYVEFIEGKPRFYPCSARFPCSG